MSDLSDLSPVSSPTWLPTGAEWKASNEDGELILTKFQNALKISLSNPSLQIKHDQMKNQHMKCDQKTSNPLDALDVLRMLWLNDFE